MAMFIDSNAATPVTGFHGDTSTLEYLKYDIVNAAHYLRPKSDVLVIGVGGGRDIISALAFDQKSVMGVEINGDILKAINQRYGDFTGHLDRNLHVRLVNDEARSYVTRQPARFDIIQVALVDTWAASSAGAFVLTENSLYTTQAWKTFLSKLTDRGVLTFSRWYQPQTPWEMYRLTALAAESLRESGVQDPRRNIILLRWMGKDVVGVGTILLSTKPFSDSDITQMQNYADQMGFTVVLNPNFASDEVMGQIANSEDPQKFARGFVADITPPTDDRPFFFNMLRLHDLAHPERLQRLARPNVNVISTLIGLAVFVTLLTIAGILVPLRVTSDPAVLRGCTPLLTYFACIGIGFMLIEVSQMQRLIVFLGHPTYALSVVLFSLLTFSGLGSLSCSRLVTRRQSIHRLGLLLLALIAFGGATPAIVTQFSSAQTATRILCAVLLLAPIGFLMGSAFPLGMKVANAHSSSITPWLWGVNGATSVCASVFAVVISLNSGITMAFWLGVIAYLAATVAYVYSLNTPEEECEQSASELMEHAMA